MDPFHPYQFSFLKWIEVNKHKLAPPVCNALMFGKGCEYKVMIVGGENTRTDYHINLTQEWFYQLQGSMVLKVVDCDGVFRDIVIREGEQFLLPAGVPHSPQRFSDTIGLVMEIERPFSTNDTLRWYCPNTECRSIVHESSFHCVDLGQQLSVAINAYYNKADRHTCKKCGTVDTRPLPNSLPNPNVAPHDGSGPDSAYKYSADENVLYAHSIVVDGEQQQPTRITSRPLPRHSSLERLHMPAGDTPHFSPSKGDSKTYYRLCSSNVKSTILAGEGANQVGQWVVQLYETNDMEENKDSDIRNSTSLSTCDLISREKIAAEAETSSHEVFLIQLEGYTSLKFDNIQSTYLSPGQCILLPRTMKQIISLQSKSKLLVIRTADSQKEQALVSEIETKTEME